MIPSVRLFLAVILLAWGCNRTPAAQPQMQTKLLPNGIRLVAVHFPGSTNASIFTFVPMGLCSDAPGKAQWSHLVEHLVIRSTILAASTEANAETLPDYMRLDFYGNSEDWKRGLDHHRRWLEGVPFTEKTLASEKPNVISECDFTARNFATHKFALAAWAQAFRHGEKHVRLKGDVESARLADVRKYRDQHLFRTNETSICIVGGVVPDVFFREAEMMFGKLASQATRPVQAKVKPGKFNLTWDLDARHLVIAWPVPDFTQADHAALMVAAHALNVQFFGHAELREQTGQILAGCDVVTPEGTFFFISASLRPAAEFDKILNRLRAAVDRLATDTSASGGASMIANQLAYSLRSVPDPALVMSQAQPGISRSMIEGNIGLMFGSHVHRYGAEREGLADRIRAVDSSKVRNVVAKHLKEGDGMIATIRPIR